MTTTETTLRPRRSPRQPFLWIVPALFVVVAALFAVNISQSTPNRESITVQNRSGAYVTLSVNGGDRDRSLGLGTVDPRSRTTFESVADQGRVWRFRLTVGPTRIGEIVLTAAQLHAAGWQVTIPTDAADALPENRR